MKKLILVTALVAASPAFADRVDAVTEDHYKDYRVSTPHTERVCRDVEVPVYSNRASTGDRIAGGIIGGLIGNQIGQGRGNTAATVIGAVTGTQLAGHDEVVGYRTEQRCENKTTHSYSHESRYSHSTVEFWDNGRKYTLRYAK